MAEQAPEETATVDASNNEQAQQEAAPQTKPTETVDFWKDKAREQEKRAKANADAAKRLADIEESQKTESQKAAERLTAAESQTAAMSTENARLKGAMQAFFEPDDPRLALLDRLQGNTSEEVAEDARKLLALITPPPARPTPFSHGARQSAQPGSMNDLIRQAAGRA